MASAIDTLTSIMHAALYSAATPPAGLIQYVLSPGTTEAVALAGAALERNDLDLRTREQLTALEAQSPDARRVHRHLATLVSEQVAAGGDPITCLNAALATPAGKSAGAVLGALQDSPIAQQVMDAALASGDGRLLAEVASCGWGASYVMRRFDDIIQAGDNPTLCKRVLAVAGQLVPSYGHERKDRATLWDAIGSDLLVLVAASRCANNSSVVVQDARQYALERVLPRWLEGAITGQAANAAIRSLVTKTAPRCPTPQLVEWLAAAAAVPDRTATLVSIQESIHKELRQRAKRAEQAQVTQSVVRAINESLSVSYGADVNIKATWLLENVPDDPAAWNLMVQIARGSNGWSPLTLAGLVETTNAVLA